MQKSAAIGVWIAILAMGACCSALAQEAVKDAAKPAAPARITRPSRCMADISYEDLVSSYRKDAGEWTQSDGASVVLSLTSIEHDGDPVDVRQPTEFGDCYGISTFQTLVTSKGDVYQSMIDSFAVRGGGPGPLPKEVFAQLQPLLDHLPEDSGRVPPAGHKLIVTVIQSGAVTVKLYDRANLPDEILTMLRLTGARVDVLLPTFQPDKKWSPDEARNLGMHDFVTKTLTVYEGSAWPEKGGMPRGGNIVRVIPEFWQPPTYGGYWVNGWFTPDGRYLLVKWGLHVGALMYDTKTWEPVTDPKLFPQNLSNYLPSEDWRLGIAVTNDGELLVWNQETHEVLSRLQGLGVVRSIAFSPNHRQVVVDSGSDENVHKWRLTIWDIQSGRMVRELFTGDRGYYPYERPVWWNGGRWMVTSSTNSKAVLDVTTGRLLGKFQLAGCDPRDNLVVVNELLRQDCFVNQAREDTVLEWSVDGVQKQIDAFLSQSAGENVH